MEKANAVALVAVDAVAIVEIVAGVSITATVAIVAVGACFSNLCAAAAIVAIGAAASGANTENLFADWNQLHVGLWFAGHPCSWFLQCRFSAFLYTPLKFWRDCSAHEISSMIAACTTEQTNLFCHVLRLCQTLFLRLLSKCNHLLKF